MQIIQDFIAVGRRNRPGYELWEPRGITEHNTGSATGDAMMHARYIKTDRCAERPASWHFTVDDQYIIQHLPLTENGWHCGDGGRGKGNRSTIGIEICQHQLPDRDRYMRGQLNAAWLTWWLLNEGIVPLNFSLEKTVFTHQRWSGKYCPQIILNSPGGWKEFMRQVDDVFQEEIIKAGTELPPEPELPEDFQEPDIDRDWIDNNQEEFRGQRDPYSRNPEYYNPEVLKALKLIEPPRRVIAPDEIRRDWARRSRGLLK